MPPGACSTTANYCRAPHTVWQRASEPTSRLERIAMKVPTNRFALLLCGGLLLCAPAARAQEEAEKPVRLKDLPPAVQTAVAEARKGAVLRGLSQETKDGQTFYEAAL